MRAFLVFCMGIFMAPVPILRAQGAKGSTDQEIAKIFEGIAADKTPGLAVLVKKDGREVFERGYGVKGLQTGSKIDAKTNFRLASVTKQFTAMAVMLLVHDKKLSYETTLGEAFPEFPEYGKKITVRQLLNHTGGLPDYEALMDAEEKGKGKIWSQEKQIQDAEVLQLLEKETKGKFAPGTKWDYSNSGYVVLGLIVARISGKPYGEFLRERIFAPLKMPDTVVYQKRKNTVRNRAYGLSKKGETFKETDQSSTSATLGDGGIYSNVEDLGKWDDALRNHTLLSENEFEVAGTPAQLPPGAEMKLAEDFPESMRSKATAYGFGWFLDLGSSHPLMWHYGETTGFKSAILRYVHNDITVIVLSNRTDLDPGALATKAAELLLNSR